MLQPYYWRVCYIVLANVFYCSSVQTLFNLYGTFPVWLVGYTLREHAVKRLFHLSSINIQMVIVSIKCNLHCKVSPALIVFRRSKVH